MDSRLGRHLIRTITLLIAGFVMIGQASAHPGHRAESRNEVGVMQSASVLVGDASEMQSPACPGHGGGDCCCDEVFAHAPPQQQSVALVSPRGWRLAPPPAMPNVRVRAPRAVLSVAFLPLIGSCGSRGPPST